MSDYIDREDALKGQKTGTFANGICFEAKACVPVDYIESLEPADVAPVRHARWIEVDSHLGYFANCSTCGYQMDVHAERGYFNFCPNCGAKMDGKE